MFAILLLASAFPASGEDTALPQEMIDAIRADAADRIIFEDDHGLLLVDTNFAPKKVYEPVEGRNRTVLLDNVYRDLMRFMADGEREMVGLLLLIKSGGFVWPAGLRFQAVLTRKDRVVATIPMTRAVYGLVGSEQELDWIDLGAGEQRTLVPRDDRLVPTQLQSIPNIYRIYMLFPARIEVEGEYRGWSPFRRSEVRFEPSLERNAGEGRLEPGTE